MDEEGPTGIRAPAGIVSSTTRGSRRRGRRGLRRARRVPTLADRDGHLGVRAVLVFDRVPPHSHPRQPAVDARVWVKPRPEVGDGRRPARVEAFALHQAALAAATNHDLVGVGEGVVVDALSLRSSGPTPPSRASQSAAPGLRPDAELKLVLEGRPACERGQPRPEVLVLQGVRPVVLPAQGGALFIMLGRAKTEVEEREPVEGGAHPRQHPGRRLVRGEYTRHLFHE